MYKTTIVFENEIKMKIVNYSDTQLTVWFNGKIYSVDTEKSFSFDIINYMIVVSNILAKENIYHQSIKTILIEK